MLPNNNINNNNNITCIVTCRAAITAKKSYLDRYIIPTHSRVYMITDQTELRIVGGTGGMPPEPNR